MNIVYDFVEVSANTWTTLTIPHGLSKAPSYVLATPYSKANGRITFVTFVDETNIYIKVFNMENSVYAVGFHVMYK